MGKDLHSVNGDEWSKVGGVGATPLGRGAKVGQGLLFAIACNCTHLKPQSAPPSLLYPHPSVHAHLSDHLVAPGIRPVTQRERGWPITMVTKQWGSNRVNQRQTLATLALSLITHSSPGHCSMCNHIAQQAGSKWFECMISWSAPFVSYVYLWQGQCGLYYQLSECTTSDNVWKLVCQMDMSC